MQTGRPPITDEVNAQVVEYQMCVQRCHIACIALAELDIEKMLTAIDRAETIGPIVDPTLWRNKSEKMAEDKHLLMTALPMAMIGRKLLERASPTQPSAEIILPK